MKVSFYSKSHNDVIACLDLPSVPNPGDVVNFNPSFTAKLHGREIHGWWESWEVDWVSWRFQGDEEKDSGFLKDVVLDDVTVYINPTMHFGEKIPMWRNRQRPPPAIEA